MGEPMAPHHLAAQVRLSAKKAAVLASLVFLLGFVRSPLLDWAFNLAFQTWRIPWLKSIELVATFSGVTFAAMFASTLLGLRTSEHRKETGGQSFRATDFIRFFAGCAALSIPLFWGQHDTILILVLILFFGLLAFFRWPRIITLDEVAISQRSLFGNRRTIPYNEVEYIRYEPKRQTTYVVGPAVTTITHTINHSDRDLFHSLLEERTKKKVEVPS